MPASRPKIPDNRPIASLRRSRDDEVVRCERTEQPDLDPAVPFLREFADRGFEVFLPVLAETDREKDLEAAIGELAKEWDGRVEVRLLGPLAAYDFVVTRTPE